MTVKELVSILKDLDPSSEVLLATYSCGCRSVDDLLESDLAINKTSVIILADVN